MKIQCSFGTVISSGTKLISNILIKKIMGFFSCNNSIKINIKMKSNIISIFKLKYSKQKKVFNF